MRAFCNTRGDVHMEKTVAHDVINLSWYLDNCPRGKLIPVRVRIWVRVSLGFGLGLGVIFLGSLRELELAKKWQ